MNTDISSRVLGNLKILEVYVYYDGPVLYSAKNTRDQMYLCILMDEDAAGQIWLYAPISCRRFEQVRTGGIDLYNAFRRVEDDYLFCIKIPFEGPCEESWVAAGSLSDEQLPLRGERLAATSGLWDTESIDVVEVAKQVDKDVLTCRFEFDRAVGHEAPAKLLGQTLESFQQLLDSVGQNFSGKPTIKGPIPMDLIRPLELSVARSYAGSFGLELHVNGNQDLLDPLKIQRAFTDFVELLRATNSEIDLIAALTRLKGRTNSKYQSLLLKFGSGLKNLEIQWGSPTRDFAEVVVISAEKALQAVGVVSKMTQEPSMEIDFVGRLVGFNVRIKTYEILDIEANRRYSGRVDDTVLEENDRPPINGLYVVKIVASTEVDPTGEPVVKHRLVGLTLASESGSESRLIDSD